MKRLIDTFLDRWKSRLHRKPLVVRGARQVGKTFSVRRLGATFDSFVEINFERSPPFATLFALDLDPRRIVREIQLMTGQSVDSGNTLLFFDEIQEAPRAILALRYFAEEMPALHVVAAGSLLEFQIEAVGMPVGRIEFLHMFPMSFAEFLLARGESLLVSEVLEVLPRAPITDAVHEKLIRLVGEYFAIGGMPEAVSAWVSEASLSPCIRIHNNILESYRQGFSKYARKHQIKYVEHLFREIPRWVGQKFKYTSLGGSFRSRELRPALELLIKGNIITQVHHTAAEGPPLGADADLKRYKLLFLDIGLMQTQLGNDTAPWIYNPTSTFSNKGQVAEAFVGQELLCYANPSLQPKLYYWHREARSSNAEVDYVIQHQGTIIPIEVKSGAIGKNRSLDMFLASHPSVPVGVLMSPQNVRHKDRRLCIPLYCVRALDQV